MSSVGDLRTVLRHRDFRKLYVARLTSQASDGMFQVALAAYVFFSPERAGTAGAAAATFAVLLLPYTVVGPFAGVFLDRWRRRQILVGASTARAGIVGLVALIAWQDMTGPLFYGTALVAISINRFYLSALSAAIPHVVRRDELLMANSVSVTSGAIAAMCGGGIGIGLGAAIDGNLSDPIVMLVAASGYLCAAALATRIGRDRLGPDLAAAAPAVREAVRHVAAGLVAGAQHIWARPAARNVLAATTALRFCYGMGALAAILLYRNYFNDPSGDGDEAMAELAVVFAAGGIGYVLAAVVTPSLSGRFGKPACVVAALLGAGFFQFTCGLPYTAPLVIVASFFVGVAAQVVKICVDTIVQESITDVFRGRVFAFYDTLFNLAFVSAGGIAALAMPDTGKSYPLLVAVSVTYVLTGLWYWHSVPRAGGWQRRPAPTGAGQLAADAGAPGEAYPGGGNHRDHSVISRAKVGEARTGEHPPT